MFASWCELFSGTLFDVTEFPDVTFHNGLLSLSLSLLIRKVFRLIEHIASFSLFVLLILFEEIQFSW